MNTHTPISHVLATLINF